LTAPRRGELLTIAIFAFALRATVTILALRLGHLSLAQYTSKADTTSYIANAAVMCGERSFASLADYDLRVFPGYPALIAGVHLTGISLPLAALLVTWTSASLAAAWAAKAFEDIRIGWAMTCLIPHYLINSSLGMSEAPLLMATCAAVLAWRRNRLVLAGLIFAFAAMIRPMACFSFAGVALALVADRKCRGVICLLIATTIALIVEIAIYQWWTGDALRGMHVYANHPGAYNGHLLGWPFQSLLTTPAIDHAGIGRIAYIWIHVLIALGICGMCIARVLLFDSRGRKPRSSAHASQKPGLPLPAMKERSEATESSHSALLNCAALPWVVGNTIFILCIGSVWGFRHFPRFTIPAAPAMFWTVRRVLPTGRGWWMAIAAACAVMAVEGTIASP
jgi:hypothetical protein